MTTEKAPPPQRSPQPNYIPPGETPTGKYRALKKQFQWGSVVAGLAMIGTIGGGAFAIGAEARAQAKQQVDAGMAPIEKRVELLEQQQAAVMTEVREMRLDLRESYKSQRYDRPSPRLEQPPPPVLVPDAGR